MNFAKWVTSFVLFCFTLSSFVQPVYSQECEYVYTDGEKDNRLLKVDGDIFFYFPQDKGRELLKTAKREENLQLKVELLNEKVVLLEGINEDKDDIIAGKNLQLQYERKLSDRLLDVQEDKSFVAKYPMVSFAIAFTVVSGAYGYWTLSDKYRK